MDKLSTESYKGVRDFYPEDEFIQRYIKDTWREVCESFGYEAYDASILEPLELYTAKSGEEIVSEQTYHFTDRGGREVALRPEMTPTVARMVAARRRELGFPLRLYSIPNLFRYERPQRGRLREHWQLNADVFGLAGTEAEIEIILLASEIMRAFGFEQNNYEIRINSREAINAFLEANLPNYNDHQMVIKLMDRADKDEEARKQLREMVGDKQVEVNDELQMIMSKLEDLGIENVRFDPNLVRGFDYYTGFVFEVFDFNPQNNRSLFGGGRYDQLLKVFGEDEVPTVGFGMGDVRLREALETYELVPTYVPATELVLLPLSENEFPAVDSLAVGLRRQGLRVNIDYTDRKIGDRIKQAEKRAVPFVAVIGPDEIKAEFYTLKNIKTGEELKSSKDEIAETIQTNLIENA